MPPAPAAVAISYSVFVDNEATGGAAGAGAGTRPVWRIDGLDLSDYSAEPSAWLRDAQAHFRSFAPEHPQRVRHWEPDKAKLARSLPDDLVGAWALVTHSSAAAVTALLSGVPVFCAPESAAYPMSSTIGQTGEVVLLMHWEEGSRRAWAGVLADNQWTLEEMKYGQCWADLQQKELA